MSNGGKGSAPRPFSVSNQEYADRWDAIFARPVKTYTNGQAQLVLLPGCERDCASYIDCKENTPCHRLDEYRSGGDLVETGGEE